MEKVFIVAYDSYEFSRSDEGFGYHFDGYCLVSDITEKYKDGFVLIDDCVDEFIDNLRIDNPGVYDEVVRVLDSLSPSQVRYTYYLRDVLNGKLDEGQTIVEGVYRRIKKYLPTVYQSKETAEKHIKENSHNYGPHNKLRIIEFDFNIK